MSRRRTIIRLPAVLASLALVWACGGDSATPVEPPDPPRPTTLTVSPATAELTALGATVQLTTEVRDQNAGVMAGAAVTWESGDTSVATVGASGLLTAVSNGSTEVIATAGPANGQARITVRQAPDAVVVEPDTALSFTPPGSVSIAPGGDVALRATVKDQNGHPITGADLAWASADTTVVRVNSFGLVEAVTVGSTEVTATAASVTGRLQITVTHPAEIGTLSTGPFVLSSLGDTVQLSAVLHDENGSDVVGAMISWESGDPSVATVDSLGLVMAVSSTRRAVVGDPNSGPWGTEPIPTVITATSGPVAEYRWDIEVQQAAVEVVVVPAADTIWGGGGVVELTATAFDANGHELVYWEIDLSDGRKLTNKSFRWSSDNPAVAQPYRHGSSSPRRVVGLSEGMATITATAGSRNGPSGQASIVVISASSERGYPIHVNFLGDVDEDLRWGIEAAAATWSRLLDPTLAAPFTFNRPWTYGGDWSEMGSFETDDMLPPGLHLYMVDSTARRSLGWGGPTGARRYGISEVPMDPVGVIAMNHERFRYIKEEYESRAPNYGPQDYFAKVHQIAMHEIGHVLGIGTSDRWRKYLHVPDPTQPQYAYLTDPDVIAVFDRLGGTAFPQETPKIPLSGDHAHWLGCAVRNELMNAITSPDNLLSELTLAALAYGYVYDAATAPAQELDPAGWNSGLCRGGQVDPPAAAPPVLDLNDVILPKP